jgi:hypothetical protein
MRWVGIIGLLTVALPETANLVARQNITGALSFNASRLMTITMHYQVGRQLRARIRPISSPDLGVFTVTAAGVLCAFPYAVDALTEQCLRRRPGTFPLSLLFSNQMATG